MSKKHISTSVCTSDVLQLLLSVAWAWTLDLVVLWRYSEGCCDTHDPLYCLHLRLSLSQSGSGVNEGMSIQTYLDPFTAKTLLYDYRRSHVLLQLKHLLTTQSCDAALM